MTAYTAWLQDTPGDWYESSTASDTILLEVVWDAGLELNDGLWYAAKTEVPVTFYGTSSAGAVEYYKVSYDGGAYESWTDYVPNYGSPKGWGMCVRFDHDFLTYGEHTISVTLMDEDGNTFYIDPDKISIVDSITLAEDIIYKTKFDIVPVHMLSKIVKTDGIKPVRKVIQIKRVR